jgi:RarD protein
MLSMAIFGSIGLFVRTLELPSSAIAMLRGLVGSLALFVVILAMKRKLNWAEIKRNWLFLTLSSMALSCNWIFLFQAFKNTTIANAVLCYYFAPVFLMVLSKIVLKEHLSLAKVCCIAFAMLGISFIVSGGRHGSAGYHHYVGIACGLMAAAFYASLMTLNKFIKNMTGIETTMMQLGLTTLILVPYVFIVEKPGAFHFSPTSIVLILILGVLHTGIGFYLFFAGMQRLNGQTIAVLSYADPLTALVLSTLLLREPLTVAQILGGALILGSTSLNELLEKRRVLPASSPVPPPI